MLRDRDNCGRNATCQGGLWKECYVTGGIAEGMLRARRDCGRNAT